MQEKDANAKARDAIRRDCPRVWIKKLNDRQTKGLPDTVLVWSGHTSWLEFKMLNGAESIHNELDGIQLVELVRLEQQCHRAWVVAYRKGTRTMGDSLTIYRPTALLNNNEPGGTKEWTSHDLMLSHLNCYGVARFQGFDHGAVSRLIQVTHASY